MIDVRLSGYSDDIVNVQFVNQAGETIHEEEFPTTMDETMYLAISDGTLITADFTSSWIFRKIRDGEGDTSFSVDPDTEDGAASVTIDAEHAWIVAGDRFEKAKLG